MLAVNSHVTGYLSFITAPKPLSTSELVSLLEPAIYMSGGSDVYEIEPILVPILVPAAVKTGPIQPHTTQYRKPASHRKQYAINSLRGRPVPLKSVGP